MPNNAKTDSLPTSVADKLNRLRAALHEMESVLIAFSGGVDSTFLAKVAHDVLAEGAAAATAASETYPEFERREAVGLAEQIGIRHHVFEIKELEMPAFRRNSPDRCYHCKRELFCRMRRMADDLGMAQVVDGANAEDSADFRPGARAAAELGVRSPLKEAGFTKDEIRIASRALGLPTWDKPSFACLSSRFPYGEPITPEAVKRVERAEAFLRELGLRQFRVRHHGNLARIEVPADEIAHLAEPQVRAHIVQRLKEIGYVYVTLDLQGYRTGAMNEALDASALHSERKKEKKGISLKERIKG